MATKSGKKLSGHLETMANTYTQQSASSSPTANAAHNEFLTICHRATARAASKVV